MLDDAVVETYRKLNNGWEYIFKTKKSVDSIPLILSTHAYQ